MYKNLKRNEDIELLKERNIDKIDDNEIKRIVGSIDGDDTTVHDIEIPFKVGDSVKVIDGPFKDFDGLVQEINDRNRIKVNVNIFGRPTPIELSFNQIIIDN